MTQRTAVYAIIALAIAGLIDTGYLYLMRLTGDNLACSILEGCNVVAASPYSEIYGVPLSLLGIFFYAAVFGIALLFFTRHAVLARKLFYIAAAVGLILSFCFSCIQAFLIGAWCIYCLISAAICTVLAVIAIWMWYTDRLALRKIAT